MNTDSYFSQDYTQARQRFLAAARTAGAVLHCLELDAWGPAGSLLSIDIAWLGSARPQRVVLHSSGIHGVEGFVGSAIQLQTLAKPPVLAADSALLLVHILNPYGMAWLRRVNAANVDLNRNFPGPGQHWTGAPAAYRTLNDFLNPASPPAWDGFLLRLGLAILRYGFSALLQAVATGQYDYPRALFYGGNALQPELHLYLDWLSAQLNNAEFVLAIDVHSGLGPWGRESLFAETQFSTMLKTLLAPRPFAAMPYNNQGGLCAALPLVLPHARVAALTQEFGTYLPLRILHALREENRWHHYGKGSLDHPSKRRLLRSFCPPAPTWRTAVLEQGRSLVQQAVAALNHFQEVDGYRF